MEAPAGDCGDCGSSRVFVLVVGEKEASVGLSGNGLGMSRIRCARFDDASLLWKDLGDEQFTTGWSAGFTGTFSFTGSLIFPTSGVELNCVFSITGGLVLPSVNISVQQPRFSPTDMLLDILARKLVVGFM